MKTKVFLAVLFVICLAVVCVAHSEQKKDVTDMRLDELPYKPIMKISKKEWGKLVAYAQKPGMSNKKANIYMWENLYRLHSWFYINLGDGMRPYSGVVDGRPSLMLFTDKEIAAEFIKSNKINERKETVGIAGFILPGTLKFIQSYENQGIQWVCFNMGPKGSFGGPINLLQTGYRWHMENDPQFKKKSKD
jgi:hypothetical protein